MLNRYSAAFAVALFAIAGCDSSGNNFGTADRPDPVPEVRNARVQLLHASPDAPEVNITGIGSGTLGPIDYKFGSTALPVPEGSYPDVDVFGILPSGDNTADPVLELSLNLERDTLYTVIATGRDLDLSTSMVFAQPDTTVGPGLARLRVAHAAPAAPEVSVFLTAPGGALDTPVITFEAGEFMDAPAEVPAGMYQVRVTLPFTPPAAPTVVYDSGPFMLEEGAVWTVAAVENTTSADPLEMDESPISLIIMDTVGSSELIDQRNPEAEVRVIHASADTPAVDVVVNGNLMMPLVPGLEFPDFAPAPLGFVEVPEGEYDIAVTDSGTQTLFPIELEEFELAGGVTYDVIAFDEFAAPVQGTVLTDDYRRILTAAKLRAFHASVVAQGITGDDGVDIYVQPAGTDLSTVDPAVAGAVLGDNTGFLQVPPGDYVITITANGDTMPLIQTPEVTLAAEGIYSAVARDPDPTVVNDVPGLILLDDFND